jgi:hypothetical protein
VKVCEREKRARETERGSTVERGERESRVRLLERESLQNIEKKRELTNPRLFTSPSRGIIAPQCFSSLRIHFIKS